MANCVASVVGSKDIQSKVSCPNSLCPPLNVTAVRYNRAEDQELMKAGEREGEVEKGVSHASFPGEKTLLSVTIVHYNVLEHEEWVHMMCCTCFCM